MKITLINVSKSVKVQYIYILLFFLSDCKLQISAQESSMHNLFTLLDNDYTGINFSNNVSDTGGLDPLNFLYAYNGGGVAIGDLDNDNLQDIVFTGNQHGAFVYKNLGKLKFKDVTPQSNIHHEGGWYTGVTLVDVNADGLLDIYLCRSGKKSITMMENLLYINMGNFNFSEEGKLYGLNDNQPSTHANFFDFDKDGDLDVYIVNHPGEFEFVINFNAYRDSALFSNGADKLLENRNGKYYDITKSSGIKSNYSFGLSVSTADINNDGFTDIYVANDFLGPDYVYINNGNGTFSDQTENYIRQCPVFSMGSDFGDINNDGFVDMMVVDMLPDNHYRLKTNIQSFPMGFVLNLHRNFYPPQYFSNVLNLSEGGKYFTPIQEMAGVAKTDWSWGILFADFNNDGWKDIYTVNGTKRDYFDIDFNLLQHSIDRNMPYSHYPDSLLKYMPVTKLKNYLFINNKNLTFGDSTIIAGMGHKVVSNGIAYADLDNDGDLEIIQNNTDTLSFIYKNNQTETQKTNFIRIKLNGADNNTFGIGAKVIVHSGNQLQMAELSNARGFQSCPEPYIHFGLGKATHIDSLEIIWPNGLKQTVYDVKTNQVLYINQTDVKVKAEKKNEHTPVFSLETIPGLDYTHSEDDFEDFKKYRLLPFKISAEGPGAVIFDFNNDHLDDIFMGGAYNGSKSVLFVQNKEGEFFRLKNQPWENLNIEITGAVASDFNNDGYADLLVTTGTNEQNQYDSTLHPYIFKNTNGTGFIIEPKNLYANGVITNAPLVIDFNADGYKDILLFERASIGKYPLGSRSFLLKNEGGQFIDVTEIFFPDLLYTINVTFAAGADMDNDKTTEIVVASEWEEIKLFKFSDGKFIRKKFGLPIDTLKGWWHALEIADVNNDNKPDILVGNQGLNSYLKANPETPVRLYYNDFDNNGTYETILTHYLKNEEGIFLDRNTMCEQMPYYRNIFFTYKSYAEHSMEILLNKEKISSSNVFTANYFRSFIIENKEDGFFIKDLPVEIQTGPVYGWMIYDFNKDGLKDILTVGGANTDYYIHAKSIGNLGCTLKNNGKNFEYISGTYSGFNNNPLGRKILKIKIKNSNYFLVINNNSPLHLYKYE